MSKQAAFPISAQIGAKAGPVPAKIVKLNAVGFIAETSLVLVVNETISATFALPGHLAPLTAEATVMKTWDRYDPSAKGKVHRLAELHFKNLKKENRDRINEFLKGK